MAARELGRAPQGRVYLFGRDTSAGHVSKENLYIYTVSYTQNCKCELSLFWGTGPCDINRRHHVLLRVRRRSMVRADVWVQEAEGQSKPVNAPYKARHPVSMHNGLTVRCDGKEWASDSI